MALSVETITTATAEIPADQLVTVAARTYLDRRDRASHPAGSFDKAGRWLPTGDEYQSCCASIRYPSRAWPYSLLVHCRTAEHVASLYGVDALTVKRTARQLDR